MRKSTRVALGAILLMAVAIRLSPLWSFLYWGSDTGEYFAILRSLLSAGRVSTVYYGWGITYPFFPGAFFPQAALVELGGIDAPTVLNLLLPVLGAFAVLPMFLLAVRVAKEPRVGLFAAAFLAGAIPHAYTTAHSAPATLGDLFVFANLLLFLRLRTDAKALPPLLLTSGSLVVTHHLSIYFFLLMVLGAVVIGGLVRPWSGRAGTYRELAFAAVLAAGTVAYWFGYATTFRDSILTDVDIRPWWLLFLAFAFGLALLAGLVALRRRISWRYRPHTPRFRAIAASWVAAAVTLFVIGVTTIVWGVPGTSVRVPPEGLVYFVPLVALMSFSAAGRKFLDFERDGFHPTVWLGILLLSALVGITVAPRVIIPYRHLEYLLIPFAIFAAIGFVRLLDLGGLRGLGRRLAVAGCGALLLANCLTGIPPPSTFAGWREGTIPAAIDPAYWARDHASGLIVTDHHASSTVFGFGGLNATWDRAADPFFPSSIGSPFAGLSAIPSPSGSKDGTYVWIDRDMEAGLRLRPWDPAFPMDPGVLQKFDNAPFVKVFDNGYARLYWIAWGCGAGC
jgi:hypothetical protein